MGRVIVTAGKDYLDIDAYGGIVGYAELLRQLGHDAVPVSTAPFNSSITPHQQTLDVGFTREYQPQPNDSFVIVDLSNPQYFDTIINPDKVVMVIDHHVGHEAYWQSRIGKDVLIEFIGAACTLVVEQWQAKDRLAHMPPAIAELLAAGIIDNTLNFKAKLTTARDHAAYDALCSIASLDQEWALRYLNDCQDIMLQDFSVALANDTKLIDYPGLNQPVAVGQLVALDVPALLQQYGELAQKQLGDDSSYWYLNMLDIQKGNSYLYTTSDNVKEWLQNTLAVTFVADTAIAPRLWLRKEIFKEATDGKQSI